MQILKCMKQAFPANLAGMDHGIEMHMLFDPGHSLDERILREQFGY